MLGWHRIAPARAATEPDHSPRRLDDACHTTITELRLTDLGHFVEVVVPTGEHAPAVDYGSDGTFLSFKTGPILLRF